MTHFHRRAGAPTRSLELRSILILLATAVFLFGGWPRPARAQHVSSGGFQELEDALQAALTDTATTADREQASHRLAMAIAQWGFSFQPAEIRDALASKMRLLEPGLVESQRVARMPDMRLHQEFRARVGAAGRTVMCVALRSRVVFPPALQKNQTPPPGTPSRAAEALIPVIDFAEVLADYGDREAVPAIQAVIDSLQGRKFSPPEWKPPQQPAWYLQRAIRRIEGKSNDLVRENSHQEWSFAPGLTVEETWLAGTMADREWKRIPIPAERALRLLRMEEHGTRFQSTGGPQMLHTLAGLRLEFPGGVEALLFAGEDGSVRYDDNTRLTKTRSYQLMNKPLADSLAALAREFGRH